MSTTLIVFLAAGVAIIAALIAAQSGGPKVTTIETKRESHDDDGKDGDDA